MPPKKQKTRTADLLQFFAKQQNDRLQKNSHQDDDDDSCQIIFEPSPAPASSSVQSAFPKTPKTPKNATKWAETLEKTVRVSGGSPSTGRDWQNPCPIQVGKKNDRNSSLKDDLHSNGFDKIHGNRIFYPIDEPIRGFELNLVKCAASSNCCIAIPASSPSTSSEICAITVFNFLKWFPRSRALLVSSSDSWISSLRLLGLEAQTTKFTTATQFKNLKTDLGRVLVCTTPQCALKVVESVESREFLEEIRLVVMDLKPNECCAKYKPIVNALTMKDTFFRCIVLTTCTSNASRRTASITKRQIMITNLQLSDWIEQSESDFAFRTSNIPAGTEVKTWKFEETSSEKLLEIVEKFENFCRGPIDSLGRDSIIPSKTIRKLIWTCWKSLKSTTSQQNLEAVELAELLTTTYKLLIIDGVVTARNFVKNFPRHDKPKIAETAQKILEIFGGFSEFPAKFQILADSIEAFLKMDNHVRGVVLCRDSDQAAEIHNFLEFQIAAKSTNFVRIVEEGTPSARNLWQLSRISTVFHDKKSPKILILPVKLRDFIGFSDSLPVNDLTFVASISRESMFNFRRFAGAHLLILNYPIEKLRKDDGRLIVDDGKFAHKDAKNLKIGAVERYDFKFEPSRLRFDAAHLPLQFFYPRGIFDDSTEITRLGKTHIEMSSKEHAELYRRLKNPDFSRFQCKKRKLCVLQNDAKKPYEVEELDNAQVCWNQDLQYLGDIKPSKMSEKLTKYLKSGTLDWAVCGEKRRYQYINEISDEKRLAHLDRLMRNLDGHFDEIT
uniref:Uncharacterized protein n=1 Tax=Caenorhabditis japonica TaxID=281687 RepID=A0A8R1HHG6_CAEJA